MNGLSRKLPTLAILLLLFSSSNATSITGNDRIDIYNSEASLFGYDTSTINVFNGANVSWIDAYDSTTVNIFGGDVSWLQLYDQSTANLSGEFDIIWILINDNAESTVSNGNISWLKAYDQGIANIANLSSLSWLLVNDDVEVNIFGSDFEYTRGHLSGYWQNGEQFSFWALEEADLFSGNISNLIPDNIRLHTAEVSEPMTILLFVVGLIGIGWASSNRHTLLTSASYWLERH